MLQEDLSDESSRRDAGIGLRKECNWTVASSITVSNNNLRNSSVFFVWMLKQRLCSSMECIMSRSGGRVVIYVVKSSSCEEATFKLRRTDSICNMVVMTYLVA